MLLEAGGVVTDPLGGPLFPAVFGGGPVRFLAGNPAAHAEAVAACRALARGERPVRAR